MIIEPVIRPPAEADSFLLQVTLGCSAQGCSFCGAYLGKSFHPKSEEEIFLDIETEAKSNPDLRRVFLMDGDALVLKNSKLIPILKKLRETFPRLSRISSYANGHQIMARSDEELRELADHGLKLVYMGLESGSQRILDQCQKRSTVRQMVQGVRRAESAGIKSSVIVLLGLGGKKDSEDHVRGTIEALNEMQPAILSFLSLMLVPGTELDQAANRGEFEELESLEFLREARDILRGLKLKHTVFRTNHASNYLPLEGRLPHDQDALVDILDAAVCGQIPLRPDTFRSL